MKLLALAAVCLLTPSLFAQKKSQKFVFKLGTEYELPKRTEDLAFFGNDKDGIVNLSLKKEELHVIRFGTKNLDITSDNVIELDDATRNFNSEEVVDFGTNYFWIHSDWDKSSQRERLFYDKIDVKTGKITEKGKKMLEADKVAGSGYLATGWYSAKKTGKFKYHFDAEKTKMLVSYRIAPTERNDKKNYDVIGLFVFDQNMQKIWGGEFTMPYTEAQMDNNDFSIDANGNAYMLAKVYEDDSRREKDKDGKAGYHFEVLKFSQGQKNPTIGKIIIDEHFIKEASLIENSLKEMVIACTYSKKAKSNGTDGVFLAKLASDGKVENYKKGYYEFPVEELQKFERARARRKMAKKEDYEAPNLKVRNVIVETDGSVLIACEENYFKVNSSSSNMSFGGVTSSSITYYNEDIIVAKINANGNMDWLRKIPKKQRGVNEPIGTMRFKLISDATGYYFLYLDNLKNIDLPEDEEPKYHVDGYGGQVVVTKIDNAGNMSKEIVFDTRDEDVMIFPYYFSRINGNQFIGRAKIKKTLFQPLLITVKP